MFKKFVTYLTLILSLTLVFEAGYLDGRGRGGGGRGGGGRGGGGRGGGGRGGGSMHRGGGGRGSRGSSRGSRGSRGGGRRGASHRSPSMSREGGRHRGRRDGQRPRAGQRPGGGRPGGARPSDRRQGGGRLGGGHRPSHRPGHRPGGGHRRGRYSRHRHHHGRWYGHSYWWVPVTWGFFAGFIVGSATSGRNYDYGGGVQVTETNIYIDGREVSLDEWSDEAQELATSVDQVAEDTEWQPLGVFAMVPQGSAANTSNIFLQLMVNDEGVISGTYRNTASEVVQSIEGRIDPESQRAAFTIRGKDIPVYETGAWNLTQDEAPMLVHYEDGTTQIWTLLRQAPEEP